MAPSREKYKRVPNLYTTGTELVLKDGTVMWLRVLNPMEVDEARHDAAVARSRLVLALKGPHAADERMKVEAAFWEDGRDRAVARLVAGKVSAKLPETLTEVRDDPEWKERLDVLDRAEGLVARAPSDPERLLVEDIHRDYLLEVTRRQELERDYLLSRYANASDDTLINEWIDMWLERRGGEVALAEYNNTEIWYAARCCDGVYVDNGLWDHAACGNHDVQVYESKEEVRVLPEGLQDLMFDAMRRTNMTAREAKNSARQGSSSVSSPLPSEVEASTPSTQTETPGNAPGPSTSPSDTP